MPRDGLCTEGGGLPRARSHPASLRGLLLSVPAWPVWWGHTLCVHIPLTTVALQLRLWATLWEEVTFWYNGVVSCPVAEAAGLGSTYEFSSQSLGMKKFQIIKMITIANDHDGPSTFYTLSQSSQQCWEEALATSMVAMVYTLKLEGVQHTLWSCACISQLFSSLHRDAAKASSRADSHPTCR